MGKNNNSSNNKPAESKGGRLANFINNFVRDPSTTIIGAGLEVLADVAGGTVRAVYNAYDRTREYIHDKKMARKMKREEEARMLNESFQQQNQEIQQQQIQSSQRFAESFGDDSYDVERASAEEVRRMSRELERIRSEFKNNAEDIERKIVDFVQDSIKDMIKEFEEINAHQIGSSSLNLNISYLKSLENQMENQITGFIQNNVKRRLSIDSDECADILRISGKAAKKNAMKDYQNTIFDDAVKSLWEMINDSIRSQNELIYSQISNRLNAMEIAAEESMKQLEEIRQAKELNEEEVAAKQSEFKNMADIAAWCMLLEDLSNTSALDAKTETLTMELNDIGILIREHIQKNAESAQNQESYNLRYDELTEQYEKKKESLQKLRKKYIEQQSRIESMASFLRTLEQTDKPIDYFDESIWRTTVEKITVFHDGIMIFQFVDGTEIEA